MREKWRKKRMRRLKRKRRQNRKWCHLDLYHLQSFHILLLPLSLTPNTYTSWYTPPDQSCSTLTSSRRQVRSPSMRHINPQSLIGFHIQNNYFSIKMIIFCKTWKQLHRSHQRLIANWTQFPCWCEWSEAFPRVTHGWLGHLKLWLDAWVIQSWWPHLLAGRCGGRWSWDRPWSSHLLLWGKLALRTIQSLLASLWF